MRFLVVCLFVALSSAAISYNNITLSHDYTLPLISTNKDEQYKQLFTILNEQHLWRKTRKPSVGCSIPALSHWYDNHTPPCPIKKVLVYAHQHSGASLLSWHLHQSPSVISIPELFCCNCPNKALSINLYTNFLCSLQLPSLGVKTAAIVLQENIFFWRNPEYGVEYPVGNGGSVVMLMRENYLARYCAMSGFHPAVPSGQKKYVPLKILRGMKQRMKKIRASYKNMYCSLRRRGVPVMMITYEELVGHFDKTMGAVRRFIGEEEGGWAKLEDAPGGHVPLVERLAEPQKVRGVLVAQGQECLLDENCDFPPVTCD